jgi:quercetin dioxygenase-like cupin family protein
MVKRRASSKQPVGAELAIHGGELRWVGGAGSTTRRRPPAGSSTFAAAAVHFTPGARTAWHTHPYGQTIFVTEGVGYIANRLQRRRCVDQ